MLAVVGESIAPSSGAVASESPSGRSLRSASAPPTPLPVTESQAKPGDVVIRWYCCLGTGDAPEQVEVERKVADDFNASHPGIHLQFEGFVYAAATTLSVQIGSGSGPDVVGPVGVGGAERFKGQWLDLQPYIDKAGIDMSQFPESTVELYNAGGEGQLGIPYASTRRCCSTRPICSRRRTRRAAARVERRLQDAGRLDPTVGLRHGLRDRQDPDGRRERQRRLAGRNSIPRRSSSGASSRSATICARRVPTSGRAPSWGRTARPPRSRSRGSLPGRRSMTASGPTTSA